MSQSLSDATPDSNTDNKYPALPLGYEIKGYIIGRELGRGGFGITYHATEQMTGRKVVIKENFPVNNARRNPDTQHLEPLNKKEEAKFKWSLTHFIDEAAILTSLEHPCIVTVLTSFKALGTAYYVMKPINATELQDGLPSSAELTEQRLRPLLCNLLNALEHLHEQGLLHRDIKPENILLRQNGQPVLIDFGLARRRDKNSALPVGSPNFSPQEFYTGKEKRQGPWSDLYSLGATCYTLITGNPPPDSLERLAEDLYHPLAQQADLQARFSPELLAGIDKALQLAVHQRWQNAREWLESLNKQTPSQEQEATPVPQEPAQQQEATPVPQEPAQQQEATPIPQESDEKAYKPHHPGKKHKKKSSHKRSGDGRAAAILVGLTALALGVCVIYSYTARPEQATGAKNRSNRPIPTRTISEKTEDKKDTPKSNTPVTTPTAPVADPVPLPTEPPPPPKEEDELMNENWLRTARSWQKNDEFLSACRKGQLKKMQQLLDVGADVNYEKNLHTPLSAAAESGRAESMKLLLGQQAIDVNKSARFGKSPVWHAAFHGKLDCLKLLLSHKASAKGKDNPLVAAIQQGHADCAALLLEHGADFNQADEKGITPISAAVSSNRLNCAQVLFKYKVDVNKGDTTENTTPLMTAVAKGYTTFINLLLKHGAKIDKKDSMGRTALHVAQLHTGTDKAVELLLLNGANINATDNSGNTPLILAARKGNVANLEILLKEKKLKINAADRYGETALKAAQTIEQWEPQQRKDNKRKCAQLLRQKGAR